MTSVLSTYVAPTATGLTQAYTINEGALSQPISPIVLTTQLNYSKSYTLTMTISGTSQSASILIECAALNGLTLSRVGDVYTMTSLRTINGTTVNNWAYFKLALQSLSLKFTNSDISQSFTVGILISDGVTNLSGSVAVTVVAVSDVTGATQTKTGLPMAFSPRALSAMGLSSIQIADPNQAAKTYSVTLTVNDATNAGYTSDLLLYHFDTANGINLVRQKNITITGTQSYINSVLAGTTSTLGVAFANRSGDFYGTTTVSYVQNVITTTEVGAVAPYVQETGTLTFTQDYTAPFSLATMPVYSEDVTTAAFSVGTLTDMAGQQWPTYTSAHDLNSYSMEITATGSYSGTNPIYVTVTGDAGTYDNQLLVSGSFAYLNTSTSPNNNVIIVPPADLVDPIPLNIKIYRGSGDLVTDVLIYDANTVINCGSTHADLILNGSQLFAIGANSMNVGSVTDLAVSKNYTSTLDFETAILATLGSSGSGGTSTWNATGGAGGFGRLTLTGTKTQVNSHLAAINYTTTSGATLDDYVNILYTQTQDTNAISQGSQSFFVGNTIYFKAGNGVHNGQSAFVYDQDVSMTWDLVELGGQINGTTSYTVKLVFSTPLTTANLGSVTGWTKETDYIWTKTGNKSTLNAALAAVVFNPPAQLITDFTLDIFVYDGVTLVADTDTYNSTKTVYLRDLVSVDWTATAFSYDQDTATTWTSAAAMNSNFNSGTYTLQLITSVATSGTFTGWTAINSTTFEKTDTKANLQTALNSLVFTPGLVFVSNFTMTIQSYRSGLLIDTSASKSVSIGEYIVFNFNTCNVTYINDVNSSWDLGNFNYVFDTSKTYRVDIECSSSTVGNFINWSQISGNTFSKTSIGSNLIASLHNLEFDNNVSVSNNFSIKLLVYRSSSLLYTSTMKSINYAILPSTVVVSEESRTWGGYVEIGWTPSTQTQGPGVSGYQIFNNYTGTGSPVAEVSNSTFNYIDISATAPIQYSYSIRSFDNSCPRWYSPISPYSTPDPQWSYSGDFFIRDRLTWEQTTLKLHISSHATQSYGPGKLGYQVWRARGHGGGGISDPWTLLGTWSGAGDYSDVDAMYWYQQSSSPWTIYLWAEVFYYLIAYDSYIPQTLAPPTPTHMMGL